MNNKEKYIRYEGTSFVGILGKEEMPGMTYTEISEEEYHKYLDDMEKAKVRLSQEVEQEKVSILDVLNSINAKFVTLGFTKEEIELLIGKFR